MNKTNLYKIVYSAVGLDEEIVELARARSFAEAAAVVRDFLRETYDPCEWIECRWIVVQLLREPEGVGIVYEPAGHEQAFVVEGGRLKPSTGPAPNPEGTEVTDTGY
jgi:hypothetical protein